MVSTLNNTSNEHPTMHPRKRKHNVSRGGWPHLPALDLSEKLGALPDTAASRHTTQPRFSVHKFRQSIDFADQGRINSKALSIIPISLYWTSVRCA